MTDTAELNPGQCPVTACLQVIGGKWKPILIFLVFKGCTRFGALARAVPGISKQMLTRQLRELEAAGVLDRKVFAEVPPRVEYSLTKRGESLLPVVHQMRDWGEAYLKSTRGQVVPATNRRDRGRSAKNYPRSASKRNR